DSTLEIPMPRATLEHATGGARDRLHEFEVLYVVRAPLGRAWSRLEAPAPVAPLEPLAFRHIWRLPAGMAPVHQSTLLRLPGNPVAYDLAGWSLTDRLPAWTASVPRVLSLDRWAVQQEQALRTADVRFRRSAAGQKRTLGEALRQLSVGGMADQGELVVD